MTNPAADTPAILIVDDCALNTLLLQAQLTLLGVPRVACARNGVEALEWLASHHCRLVLTDCQMPHMDGLEMTRQIRASDTQRDQPRIVALTADDVETSRPRCLDAGMQDCYTRPIALGELAAILGRAG
jgi:CheY-like chemotaxis protein